MSLLRLLSGLAAMASLAGCAATPKPTMSDAEYKSIGTDFYIIEKCAEAGQITPDTALWAKRSRFSVLSRYAYDQSQINYYYNQASGYGSNLPQRVCNQVSVSAREYQVRTQEHNAQVEQNQRDIQNYINKNQIQKPVFCNRIGNQVLCN